MYNWNDDETGIMLVRTLVEIADRGVQIEILKETTGDLFELDQDFHSTQNFQNSIWELFWNHPNISVHFTTDENHSKVFIIDGVQLLVGSMNIGDHYLTSWDYLVELRGKHFVRSYLLQSTEKSGKVRISLNTESSKDIRNDIERIIEEASSSVVVQHPYLGDTRVRSLLAQASHRGVRITLYIPQKANVFQNTNLEFVEKLLEDGDSSHISVRLLPGFMHGKLLITDCKNICVGSANLFTHSLDTMGETNVIVSDHKNLHLKLRKHLCYLRVKSSPLISMPRRGLQSRILSRIGL